MQTTNILNQDKHLNSLTEKDVMDSAKSSRGLDLGLKKANYV